MTQIRHHGVTYNTPTDIKATAVSYFSDLFKKGDSVRAIMGYEGFDTLTSKQVCELEKDFIKEQKRFREIV
jgi:hypothetical protein